MRGVVLKWKFIDLVRMIVATLLNKYDFFLVIEGGTGIGKSTLAYHIASKVSQEFRRLYKLNFTTIKYYYDRIGKEINLTEEEFIQKITTLKANREYLFNPKHALIYTQDELQRALASWHNIAIPDEMINITFNRDFYSEKQKDIIKMLNMFRDHENLTIACVPQFQNLDTQIKNLAKMKITVKKRGVAIIHTPNPVVYSKDKWDAKTNESIEKNWIVKKIRHPNYSKLTTFRGLVRFPPLTKRIESIYQQIKNEKRTTVLKVDMKVDLDKKDDPFEKFFKRFVEGGVKNSAMLEGFAVGLDMNKETLIRKLRKRLAEMNKPTEVTYYYWDRREKTSPAPLTVDRTAMEHLLSA